MEGQDDRERLKKNITVHFNRLFNDMLSLIQVLVKNDYQYTAIRAKVLRSGNNILREIMREIDSYDVKEGSRPTSSTDEYTLE